MHTSDYMPEKRAILVFRGGDGQAYLNDLHTLDVETYECVAGGRRAEGQVCLGVA